MNRDDIIKLAQDCGIPEFENNESQADNILRFAALVAAAERQRLHDKFMDIHKSQQHSNNYWHFAARKIAEET